MTAGAAAGFAILSDAGSGRPFVLLHELGDSVEAPRSLAAALQQRTRAILIQTPRISDSGWEEQSAAFGEFLSNGIFSGRGTRQASFVTFGACGSLVQSLALQELKSVRTIVFIDAATRAHPSDFTKLVDRIEHALPLGLPLRLKQTGFDAKPFLQRIRCPVLVVTSPAATPFQLAEAEVLEAGLPTAWRIQLPAAGEPSALASLVLDFQEIPAKCPQKPA